MMFRFVSCLILAVIGLNGTAYAQMRPAEPRSVFELSAGGNQKCLLAKPANLSGGQESLLGVLASSLAGDLISGFSSATVGAVKSWLAAHVSKNTPPPVVVGSSAETAYVTVEEKKVKATASLRCIVLVAGTRDNNGTLTDDAFQKLLDRQPSEDPEKKFLTEDEEWRLEDYQMVDYPNFVAEFHVNWDSTRPELMKVELAGVYVRRTPVPTGRRDHTPFDAYITLSISDAQGGSEQAVAIALPGLQPGTYYAGHLFSAVKFWLPNPAAPTLKRELEVLQESISSGAKVDVDSRTGEVNISASYAQSRDPSALLTFMSTVVNAVEPSSIEKDLNRLLIRDTASAE
jgi:hypothetical protein